MMFSARKALSVVALATASRTSFRFQQGAEAFAFRRGGPFRFDPTPLWFRRGLQTCGLCANQISISDAFDGGSIELVEKISDDSVATVALRIKPDPFTELEQVSHLQHFYFRSTVQGPLKVKYVIENAAETSYANAWHGTTVCFSMTQSEPNSWRRKVDTIYENGQLSWTHTHQACASVYFSFFPPFSYERHLTLISECAASCDALVTSLGQSLDGREIDSIKVGTGPRVCWIVHRQHPGEAMAEFYAEGLLNRLLGLDTGGSIDGMARRARELFSFYIVPSMCPDGAVRGHLRTNALGSNLNREWAPTKRENGTFYEAPTMERSPEVYLVLKAMDETGVDVFLDVHGDEELPFNFLAGAEGCPNWGPRLKGLQGAFMAAYCRANSDMQPHVGYEPEPPLQGRLNTCSNQIATRFDCLAFTLEMPFKDCLSNPDPERGWSPARAIMLGASALDALVYVHPYLREESEFWIGLPEGDDYIEPSNKY